MPGTKARNEVYIAEAHEALRRGRPSCDRRRPTTSRPPTSRMSSPCPAPGSTLPGPEYSSCASSVSSDSVQRYHLGFMGCYATMPALRAAKQFCDADADAVVLVVSVELCTLHLRSSERPGHDRRVLAVRRRRGGRDRDRAGSRRRRSPACGLDRFETAIAPEGEEDMAWTIGDNGFEMILSTTVPQIIGETIIGALASAATHRGDLVAAFDDDAVGRDGRALGDPSRRAQHPGSRAGRSCTSATRSCTRRGRTLRENGNMSSATVLFVLQQHPRGRSRRRRRSASRRWRSGRG